MSVSSSSRGSADRQVDHQAVLVLHADAEQPAVLGADDRLDDERIGELAASALPSTYARTSQCAASRGRRSIADPAWTRRRSSIVEDVVVDEVVLVEEAAAHCGAAASTRIRDAMLRWRLRSKSVMSSASPAGSRVRSASSSGASGPRRGSRPDPAAATTESRLKSPRSMHERLQPNRQRNTSCARFNSRGSTGFGLQARVCRRADSKSDWGGGGCRRASNLDSSVSRPQKILTWPLLGLRRRLGIASRRARAAPFRSRPDRAFDQEHRSVDQREVEIFDGDLQVLRGVLLRGVDRQAVEVLDRATRREIRNRPFAIAAGVADALDVDRPRRDSGALPVLDERVDEQASSRCRAASPAAAADRVPE